MIKYIRCKFSNPTAVVTVVIIVLAMINEGGMDGGGIITTAIWFLVAQLFAWLIRILFGPSKVILTAILANILSIVVFYLILFSLVHWPKSLVG